MITIWMDKGANKFKKQKLTWITLNISLVPTCNLAQFAIVTSSIPLKEQRLFKISVIDWSCTLTFSSRYRLGWLSTVTSAEEVSLCVAWCRRRHLPKWRVFCWWVQDSRPLFLEPVQLELSHITTGKLENKLPTIWRSIEASSWHCCTRWSTTCCINYFLLPPSNYWRSLDKLSPHEDPTLGQPIWYQLLNHESWPFSPVLNVMTSSFTWKEQQEDKRANILTLQPFLYRLARAFRTNTSKFLAFPPLFIRAAIEEFILDHLKTKSGITLLLKSRDGKRREQATSAKSTSPTGFLILRLPSPPCAVLLIYPMNF